MTKDWSEEEEDGQDVFAPSCVTVRTPIKKHNPDDTNKAPKKKEPTITTKPEGVSALRIPASHRPDTTNPHGDETNDEFSVERAIQNLLEAVEKVQDVLKMDIIRKHHKDAALINLGHITTNIKALGEKIKESPDKKGEEQHAEGNITLSDIMKELTDLKTEIKKPTYAQAAARTLRPEATGTQPQAATHQRKEEQIEDLRLKREKSMVVLTTRNASDATKRKLASNNEENITKEIQQALETAREEPTKIHKARKTSNHGIRITCTSDKSAEELRHLDWNNILEGVKTVEETYGIVIHGVPKDLINFETDTAEEIKAKVEKANPESLEVVRVAPLRKHTRNPHAGTQSIIVFVRTRQEANYFIEQGINIGSKHYWPTRYTPQCQVRQCYHCQGFGHKADICTKPLKCGKCAEAHDTRECKASVHKCANCNGTHYAYEKECPNYQR